MVFTFFPFIIIILLFLSFEDNKFEVFFNLSSFVLIKYRDMTESDARYLFTIKGLIITRRDGEGARLGNGGSGIKQRIMS